MDPNNPWEVPRGFRPRLEPYVLRSAFVRPGDLPRLPGVRLVLSYLRA